jgi:hypothetical protein
LRLNFDSILLWLKYALVILDKRSMTLKYTSISVVLFSSMKSLPKYVFCVRLICRYKLEISFRRDELEAEFSAQGVGIFIKSCSPIFHVRNCGDLLVTAIEPKTKE